MLGNNDRPVIFLQTGESLLRVRAYKVILQLPQARPTSSLGVTEHQPIHPAHNAHFLAQMEIESSMLDEGSLKYKQIMINEAHQARA